MDNQNNQNNQNPQNGYTNFNNYQPQPNQDGQQQPPVYPQGQPMQMPYQPQMPYQAAVQPEQKNKSLALGIISIVLSAISVCGCSFFTSVPGAILGIIGVVRNKKSVVSWIGLVLGVVASICWIAYMVYMFSNPDQMRSLLEQAYGEDTADQLMQSLEFILITHCF